MVADSGWALIPSMFSSRFLEQRRATGSNLAYNGGLANDSAHFKNTTHCTLLVMLL